LYRQVGDVLYNYRAPLYAAWILIAFTIPVLFSGWMQSAASASMLSATSIMTQTLLPVMQSASVRALSLWGFQLLRTGVTATLLQSTKLSTELKLFLVKLGPALDGVLLAVFFMAAPKAIHLLSRLFGELLPSTAQELYNAVIATPPDLSKVSIPGAAILENGQTLQAAVTEAIQGPTVLATSAIDTHQTWTQPAFTQLHSASTLMVRT
jgi:hypothetical protein